MRDVVARELVGNDAARRLSSIDVTKGTTTTVVNNITYEPFGPAISWDYGNGLTADLPVDSDYRIESVTHGTMMDVGYLYDDADNILDFDDLLSTYDEDFVYDDLNRLTDVDGDYGIWTFQYDATGNRTYATQGLLSDTYSYISGGNRLSIIVGDHAASYTYDANGNVIDDGTYDYFYGDDNRLYRIDDAGGTIATYTHNARGERVKKDTGLVTYYHYDVSGRLLAEIDGSGNTIREYVYLEDRPVAFLDGSTIYYIHGDHLGTPHVVTNGAQTVVWQARYKPFGETNVVINTVALNLRYPGQYLDAEVGLHYNYFRDYDPSTGRYIQPDPIGLRGGINLFAYANGNPVRFTDPNGKVAVNPVTGAIAGTIGGGLGAFVGTLGGGGDLRDAFSNSIEGALSGFVPGGVAGFAPGSRFLGLGGAIGTEILLNGAAGASSANESNKRSVRRPPSGASSPDPVDEATKAAFCKLNPSTPNCQEEPCD